MYVVFHSENMWRHRDFFDVLTGSALFGAADGSILWHCAPTHATGARKLEQGEAC